MREDFALHKQLRRFSLRAGMVAAVAVSIAMTGLGEGGRLLRKADKAFASEDYKTALQLYNRAVSAEPRNATAYHKLGLTYLQLNQPQQSLEALQQATALDANLKSKLYLPLAEAYQRLHEFKAARQLYRQEQQQAPAIDKTYQAFLSRRLQECEAGEELLRLPSIYIVSNVGEGINSAHSDYVPVLMPGDEAMLFTTRRPTRDKRQALDEAGAEQIRVSKLQGGEWQSSELFLEPQGQMPYHAVVSVAPHGRELYTFFADKGLHVSHKLETGEWTAPELLQGPFNQGNREPSLYVTDDGKFAFFSSDRPGGYGGLDIYVSYKKEDGNWSEALNLGPEVNTAYDEDAPFVDFKTNTLYFSSRGHNTMGGFDIFRSSISGGKWGSAQNLGYPVNSASDDLYFSLSADRSTAYISSDRPGGLGGKDIYRILFR